MAADLRAGEHAENDGLPGVPLRPLKHEFVQLVRSLLHGAAAVHGVSVDLLSNGQTVQIQTRLSTRKRKGVRQKARAVFEEPESGQVGPLTPCLMNLVSLVRVAGSMKLSVMTPGVKTHCSGARAPNKPGVQLAALVPKSLKKERAYLPRKYPCW